MSTQKFKPIVCIDFDGVLHSYISKWESEAIIPDQPVPGAQMAIQEYLDAGFRVAVFSSRSGTKAGRQAMAKWCTENNFPDGMEFPKEKPPAILNIDDRGFCFEGNFPTADFIMKFKPWNRR
jgi:hypothetical protein